MHLVIGQHWGPSTDDIWALDSGCVWGGCLTAIQRDKPEDLPPLGASYFLLIRTAQAGALAERTGAMSPVLSGDWVDHKTGTLPRQIELAAGRAPLESFSVYKVTPR